MKTRKIGKEIYCLCCDKSIGIWRMNSYVTPEIFCSNECFIKNIVIKDNQNTENNCQEYDNDEVFLGIYHQDNNKQIALAGGENSPVELQAVNDKEQIYITQRELEVCELLKQGLKNKEIAESLNISTRTVETNIYTLLRKSKCSNRSKLLAFYLQNQNLFVTKSYVPLQVCSDRP